jgi:PelA/Pel-15E family pectate lyase
MWDPVYLELPPEIKAPWDRWLAEGVRLRQQEIEIFSFELAKSGRRLAAPAKVADAFEVPQKSAAWFAGADARKIADNLLSWQTPSGGWTKNTAMTRQRRAPGQRWSPWGEWGYVATIDNKATTSQIEFLARVATATKKDAYAAGAERGLRYLLAAQMPSGGWPQVFPLQGTYHDQITFNDDAMVRVLTQLKNIKNDKAPWQWVSEGLRRAIEASVQAGIGCILRSQIRVGSTLTGWCAQHHPVSLAPVGARSYELPSLSGAESVEIARFLMSLGNPVPEVRASVEAVVAWLRRSGVDAAALGKKGSKGPQWARFYEIETNRPLFSDTDGEKRYSFHEVKAKRNSYAWFTEAPEKLLSQDYPKWRRKLGAAL